MLAWKEGWGVFAVGEFVAYVAAGVEAWGKPFHIVIEKRSHVAWKYPQNVIAELMRYEWFVHLNFCTLQGVLGYE